MLFLIFIISAGIIGIDSRGCLNDLKFPLEYFSNETKSIPCPDGQSSCPDGETCCELSSGQYGCCPLPDAICCTDHLHCCPSGYTCDVEHSRCQKGFDTFSNVVCPGGEMSCSDGETCCELESGDYGCCPLPDAVCCNDHSHCCPHGYTCDVEHNKCEKGQSIPWFTKKAATPINRDLSKIRLSTIQCPDQKSFCPEETTCCELVNGEYGCCPYPDASCCSDKIHCCGEGYSCDESGSRCIRHLHLINSTKIQLKFISLTIIDEQICPDGITKCSLNSTCCPNQDKTYSCCSYSRGVCCGSNGSICCPFKYICDEKELTCQLNRTITFEDEHFNQCGTSNVICPLNETCCKSNDDDQYSCCSFPQGVCCDDGRHCCPKDTICDQNTGGCIKQ